MIPFLKKASTTMLATSLTSAGTFLFNVLLANWLSLEEYGAFILAFTGLTVITMFSRLGTDASLMRFAGAAWVNDNSSALRLYVSTAIRLVVGLSILGTIFGLVGAVLLEASGKVGLATGVLMALAVLPRSLLFVASGVFRSIQRPAAGALLEAGCVLALACIALVAMRVFAAEVTPTTAAATVLASASVLCASVMFRIRSLKLTDPEGALGPLERRDFLTASREMGIANGLQTAAIWGGTFALAAVSEESEIAGFAVALRLVLLVVLYRNVVLIIAGPRLAALHERNDSSGFERTAQRTAFAAIALCSVPIAAILILPATMLSLFGSEYEEFVPVLTVLALGQLVPTVTAVTPWVLSMTDEQRSFRQVAALSTVVSLPLTALLSSRFDAVGAAVGTATYWLLLGIGGVVAIKRTLGFVMLPNLTKLGLTSGRAK